MLTYIINPSLSLSPPFFFSFPSLPKLFVLETHSPKRCHEHKVQCQHSYCMQSQRVLIIKIVLKSHWIEGGKSYSQYYLDSIVLGFGPCKFDLLLCGWPTNYKMYIGIEFSHPSYSLCFVVDSTELCMKGVWKFLGCCSNSPQGRMVFPFIRHCVLSGFVVSCIFKLVDYKVSVISFDQSLKS